MPLPNLNCSLQRILPPSSVVWLLATEDQKKKGGNNCGKLDNKTNDQKEEDNKDKYRSRRHTIFAAGYPTNFWLKLRQARLILGSSTSLRDKYFYVWL